MKLRRMILLIISVTAGVFLSLLSCLQAERCLFSYYEGDEDKYSGIDLLNTIFISDNIKATEYLDDKNIMLLLPIITFVFAGFLIGCSFVIFSDRYKYFIASRCRNSYILDRIILDHPLPVITVYVLSFMIPIMVKYGTSYLSDCSGMALSHILFLDTTVNISYFIHKRFNSTAAVVSGLIIICLVYMADMYSTGIHLILYSQFSEQIRSVIILMFFMAAVKIFIRLSKRKEFFYVH